MMPYDKMSRSELISELKNMQATLCEDGSDAKRLLHELQVHQIELEMQNRQLQESQEALQKSHERYFTLFDFAPIGYAVFDDAGYVKMANLMLASMLGIERSALIGSRFVKFVQPAGRSAFGSSLRYGNVKDKTHIKEFGIVRDDGSVMIVQMQTQAEYGDAGSRLDFRSAIIDITEKKQLQDKLVEQIDEVQRFNKLTVSREEHMEDMKNKVAMLTEENENLRLAVKGGHGIDSDH